MTAKPRLSIPKLSKKRKAELESKGERAYSTIRPKVSPTRAKARKPIPKANPERQKKAAKRGAAKHRKYMASETRKLVEIRSGGQCEYIIRPEAYSMTKFEPFRCEAPATGHHHKTYARYGGDELPEDMLHACKPHHDYLESLKLGGNRRSRRVRTNGGS